MAEVIRNADYRSLVLAFIVFLVVNFILLVRWQIFIRALGLDVPLKRVAKYLFIGLFFNLFLPTSTGGDIVKTIGLCRDTEHKAKVVASVICDRVGGFIAMVIVAVTASLLGFGLINDISVFVSIGALAGISIALVLFLFNETLYSFCCRVFNRAPAIKEKFMNLHYAIAFLKGRLHYAFIAIGLSCVSQVIFAFNFYLVARALHQNIAPVYFFAFVPIICVISSLPSIGGLGVRDAGTAYYLAKAGIETATSVSISLIQFLFMVIIGLIGGLVYVVGLTPRERTACSVEVAAEAPQ